ncbi:MAG: 2-hydroxyacyl-CoA dehydratase, partial [Nitrospinota bacterium]|nr:2-hydroxyacyl-CoA dehydratase [Nitrospinota bacterium]
QSELALLRDSLGASEEASERWRARLNRIRRKLDMVDLLTWRDGKVTGFENHLLLVSSSDFDGDPDGFETKIDRFLEEARQRPEIDAPVRLGMIGIPPIMEGLHEFMEMTGAHCLYNEVARQFTMPFGGETLAEQYLAYTYPYQIGPRIDDIQTEIERRQIDGIVHYVQSFCHRQMEDLIFRERLDIPILTIEGDAPRAIDARTKIRLESFIRMLAQRKGAAV